jgi:ATP-dependent RNA helicase RhlE
LPHVVNYELPHVPEDYVHRIGRTGRAGAEGEAISLVCVDEHKLLAGIEKLIKRQLPKLIIEGFEPDMNAKPEPILQRSNDRNGRGGQRGGGQRQSQPRSGGNASRGGGGGGGNSGGNSGGQSRSGSGGQAVGTPDGAARRRSRGGRRGGGGGGAGGQRAQA